MKIEEAGRALADAVGDVEALRRRGERLAADSETRALLRSGIRHARQAERRLRAAQEAIEGVGDCE